MAEVVIADGAGACFGVERALEMARKAAVEHGGDVATLGPLIHNPQVVKELEDAGVVAVESVEDAAGKTLILRTHGVSRAVEERAAELCPEVLDATCPFVKRVHAYARAFEQDGLQLVIVGEKGHPEVEGTRGQVENALVVGTEEEALEAELGERLGVVVQTTLAAETLARVMAVLEARVPEVHLENTICKATSLHQEGAAKLAAEVDAMVVVGGKNSANTKHLAEICSGICPQTQHVETVEELDAAPLRRASRVGITAGASTPTAYLAQVKERIEQIVGC